MDSSTESNPAEATTVVGDLPRDHEPQEEGSPPRGVPSDKASTPPLPTTRAGSRRRRIILAAVGALLLLVGALLLIPRYNLHTVGTIAMSPTAKAWDDTVVDTDAIGGKGIQRGDIVLVRSGDWDGDEPGLSYTIRVVAMGGDTVSCDDQGRLTVNDQAVNEPYAHGNTAAFGSFTVKVPAGRIFVLGDARSISVDSRSHLKESDAGTLPLTSVQGQLVAVAWPFGDWGFLSGPAGASQFPVYLIGVTGILLGTLLELAAVWPTLRRWSAWALSRIPRRRRTKAW